jgi:hypothetical protein
MKQYLCIFCLLKTYGLGVKYKILDSLSNLIDRSGGAANIFYVLSQND